MSELESSTKPLLLPMIRGEQTVLTSDADKRLLATWALNTAITIQAAKKVFQMTGAF